MASMTSNGAGYSTPYDLQVDWRRTIHEEIERVAGEPYGFSSSSSSQSKVRWGLGNGCLRDRYAIGRRCFGITQCLAVAEPFSRELRRFSTKQLEKDESVVSTISDDGCTDADDIPGMMLAPSEKRLVYLGARLCICLCCVGLLSSFQTSLEQSLHSCWLPSRSKDSSRPND